MGLLWARAGPRTPGRVLGDLAAPPPRTHTPLHPGFLRVCGPAGGRGRRGPRRGAGLGFCRRPRRWEFPVLCGHCPGSRTREQPRGGGGAGCQHAWEQEKRGGREVGRAPLRPGAGIRRGFIRRTVCIQGIPPVRPQRQENGVFKGICDRCGSQGSAGEPSGNAASPIPGFLLFLSV